MHIYIYIYQNIQLYTLHYNFICLLYPNKTREKSPSTGPISEQALRGGLAAGIRGTLSRSVALEGKASRAWKEELLVLEPLCHPTQVLGALICNLGQLCSSQASDSTSGKPAGSTAWSWLTAGQRPPTVMPRTQCGCHLLELCGTVALDNFICVLIVPLLPLLSPPGENKLGLQAMTTLAPERLPMQPLVYFSINWWSRHQQPQICRWCHPNGRKWKGTKESLDEGERGEWKGWLRVKRLA